MLRRHHSGKKRLEEKRRMDLRHIHIEATWEGVLAAECVGYFDYVFLINKWL